MKTHLSKSCLLLFLLVSLTFDSCKKFEEGPLFSLRTRRARLTDTWTYKKIEIGGEDKSSQYYVPGTGRRMTISSNHSFLDFGIKGLPNEPSNGNTWKLTERRSVLAISQSGSHRTLFSYKILRLTNTELWLKLEGTDAVMKLEQ